MNIETRTKLSEIIEKGEPIRLSFKYLDATQIMFLNGVVVRYLSRRDSLFLLNSIVTILREVVVNALKANAKRVFFLKNNLDINNQVDYEKGMERFKEEVIGDFELIESDLQNSDFYIKILFLIKEDNFIIRVSNNVSITSKELERINYRIDKAIEYDDFSEVYEHVDDDSEGAGLGIVLTVLFLKNMGVNPRNFKISSDKGVTNTTLTIPKKLRSDEITNSVKKHILEEVTGIPTFPDNIKELEQMCNNPDVEIDKVSKKIELDPALSVDVIKLSNSAGFITGNKIESINTAVMTIGLKNVLAILLASNSRRILDERYGAFEDIWEHCYKTAFYARKIAIALKKSKSVVENAYMGGLLHDLGKIILLATDVGLVEKISELVHNRKIITATIMEEISIGISHPKIGALLAEKWDFPKFLQEAIEFHHSPLSASVENWEVIKIVYFANIICGIEDRRYTYFYIEESILEEYNLFGEEKFKKFHDSLKKIFEKSKEN